MLLRDGGSVVLRAIRAEDKQRLADLFARLSPRSVRYRVFGAKSMLSETELAYLTELDFTTHVALAACAREAGKERILAVGRYCCKPTPADACRRAEVAFAVADDHRGRGLGTLLLEHLARIAAGAGVEELEADVLIDNDRMMEVFANSGFVVQKTLDAGIYHVTFPTRSTEAFVAASVARERQAAAESVRVFFEPASVAVIGASRRPGSIGRIIVANLRRAGFRGPIHPVNPNAREVEGLRASADLASTPGRVDLAVIAVPAPSVERVITECADAGVRGVVVISAGFAEVGGEGAEAQRRLRALVRSAGMRMVGPNCMGVLNAAPDIALDATFAPTWPPPGNVSMVTQSGALGITMLDHAASLNIGIAGFVSVGNKADVSSNDLLSYWADDPATEVIVMYLESVGNPRKFARIAPEVARRKPIVAVKSGRSAAGTRAATSHSAALASLDVCVDALFTQAGVIRTNTLEEMFDVTALLSTQPLPRGARVGVVTNAGGPGILFADACEAHGLELPALDAATTENLRAFLPKQASLANPVDMIASATPDHYRRVMTLVGADPNVDALVVIYIPPVVTEPEEIAGAIAAAAGDVPSHKPIATVFMSSKGAPPVLSGGPRGKLPSYSFPENAALALASATRYARWRERPRGEVMALGPEQERVVRRVVEDLVARATSPFWVRASDVERLLRIAGVELAPSLCAVPDPDAVAAAAERLGYPVVAKAIAPGLVHKSDIGGVLLGLGSPAVVRDAARLLAERARAAGKTLEGILVQRQVDPGVEAIAGITCDPSFGPVLVAGFGGARVELLRDVAMRLTPVSDHDVDEMLSSLRAAALLEGFRGAPPADRAALVEVIRRLGALVEVIPELVELELNPIEVLERGRGAIVVDARMRLSAH